MKDYYAKGKKIGLNIYDIYDKSSDMIQNFSLNKENGYVKINYMRGSSDTFLSADEVDIEELKEKQRQQFDAMERDVTKEANVKMRSNGILTGMHCTTGVLLLLLGNFGGISWICCSSIWFIDVYRPWKLKKEMSLVKWTYDNRDKVNDVISEEVEAVVDKEKVIETDMTHMIPVATKFEFPENSPYPEIIYNEGIDLNNVDMLTTKQLRRIKRKVLKKNRRGK